MKKNFQTIYGGASLRVIENKELLCNNCILGKQERSNTIVCHLNQDEKRVESKHFCGQGMWILDGKVMDFKEAWAYINKEDKSEYDRRIVASKTRDSVQ